MPEMTQYEPGTFSWADLATTDPESAKRFYAGLFGWAGEDMPAGEGLTYSMMRLDGKDVAALYEMSQDQRSQGTPPHWLSYFTVDDLDSRARRVAGMGGKLLAEPFDVLGIGRMALVHDPTGAVFALWEPKTHIGAGLKHDPGSLTWNELLTKDPEAARSFYGDLFGWDSEDQQMGPATYTVFSKGDEQTAGMMEIDPNWGDVPPNWTVYFAVEDCDAAAEKAEQLGGQVRMPSQDVPGVGRFAAIQDPQGANFSIIKLDQPA